MKTGAELITEKRQRQIEVHGYTLEMDSGYTNGELLRAAKFCLNPMEIHVWPVGWNVAVRDKIRNDYIDRVNLNPTDHLATAGAFIAAEIDRRQNSKLSNE